jgi:hypothetical protein
MSTEIVNCNKFARIMRWNVEVSAPEILEGQNRSKIVPSTGGVPGTRSGLARKRRR